MLTPEKIQAMNKATGLNAPVTGGTTTPPTGPSRADQIRALAKQVPTQTGPSQPLADDFSKGFGGAVIKPLLRTGNMFQGALDQSLGRGINIATGKGNVPTHTADVAEKVINSDDLKTPDTFMGKTGEVVGTIAPYLTGAGEEETAANVAQMIPKLAEHMGVSAKSLIPKVVKYLAENAPTVARDIGIGTAQTGDIKSGVEQGVAGAVGVGLAKGATKLVGDAVKAIPTSLDKSVEATMPLENKATRIDALRDALPDSEAGKGGVARKGILGKSKIQASEEDIVRGNTAHKYIEGEIDPVKRIQNVNKGIIDESADTDNFLNSHTVPSNFEDMRNYMETNRPSSHLQKDPGAASEYDRVTQDALDTLYSVMKKSAKDSGDFTANTSVADVRKARIAIDSQIKKELGENTFGTPQYKGIRAAEIDTRNLLNRMSEDLLRYPGQMERLNRMNEFVAASKQRGIEVDLTNPEVRQALEKQFGLTPSGEHLAQELVDRHAKMSELYDARDNMIDKYQTSIGRNQVDEAIRRNPALKGGIEVAKKVIPFGIGTHL